MRAHCPGMDMGIGDINKLYVPKRRDSYLALREDDKKRFIFLSSISPFLSTKGHLNLFILSVSLVSLDYFFCVIFLRNGTKGNGVMCLSD